MTKSATAWRVDAEGRLLSPDGAFVAVFREGVIFFYDKKRGTYTPFTLSDWWALMSLTLNIPNAPPQPNKKAAGAWGEK